MIVLDTNVLSELLRPTPDAAPLRWLTAQESSLLFTTSVTQSEILYGVQILPKGRRRDSLKTAVQAIFDEDFAGRILAFDSPAARHFADIAANRRAKGTPISQPDAQIAAITRSKGARLATRNIRDFDGCDLTLIDPWTAR